MEHQNKRVMAAVDDLFFAAKIRAAAASLGMEVSTGRSLNGLMETAREVGPSLLLVDLHAKQFDPLELARLMKRDEQLSRIKLLGFFSHVQTGLMRQAKEAGFDHVLPRSAFASRLGEILEGKFFETAEGPKE